MITVSRISWEEQLLHSPNVLSDLKACGMTIDRHNHVQVNTMAGLRALFGRRPPDQIAILDAIPLLPTLIRLWCWPNVLLSTHGDRYIHMLFERLPLTGWILSLAEWIETIDARSSTIVKSSGLAALDSLKRKAPGPSYVHCPDRFLPYERRKVLIYQGVLRWDKGVDAAIRYANENNAMLIVVGDGPDRKRLMRVARSIGADVHFVGRVANPEPFWRIADEALVCRRKTRGNENAYPGLIHRAQAQNVKIVVLQEN